MAITSLSWCVPTTFNSQFLDGRSIKVFSSAPGIRFPAATAAIHKSPYSHSASLSKLNRWNSLVQNAEILCSEGRLDEALWLLQKVQNMDGGVSDLAKAMGSLIQACGKSKRIDIGKEVHELISSDEILRTNVVLATGLVTMYSKCGFIAESRRVFDSFDRKNLFLWNAMIGSYARNDLCEEALSTYGALLFTEIKPDNFTLPCVIKASAGLLDVKVGKEIHGRAVKLGLQLDVFIGNALISMYGKCGCLKDATQVFDKMTVHNLVSWNTLIFVLAQNGFVSDAFEAFMTMQVAHNMRPDVATLVIVLPVCASEEVAGMGRLLHGLAVKLEHDMDITVNNALIDMYARCGNLECATRLFEKANQRSVVTWNVMIAGYSRNGDCDRALELLRIMLLQEGFIANSVTVLNTLPACSEPSKLSKLKEIHCYAVRNGLNYEELVANMLVSAYAKCGNLNAAELVFSDMDCKEVNSWDAIIGGHAQNGDAKKAMGLFLEMRSSGVPPDCFTLGSITLACTHLTALADGKQIHGYVLRNDFEMDSFIGISLLSLYIRCKQTLLARNVFDLTHERNAICWNAMIAGHAQNGFPDEALTLFFELLKEGIHQPEEIAIMGALTATAQLASLQLGRGIHCFVLKRNLGDDVPVGSSIIDMYVKSGCLEGAWKFFDRLPEKDTVTWNVMISGCGIHGQGDSAILLFEQMNQEGLKPDALTLIGLLTACSHSGLVDAGELYFSEMQSKHGIEPTVEHYACMIDMLGRAGCLEKAARMVEDMPMKPDYVIWSALLGACKIHPGNEQLGERAAEQLISLEVEHAGGHVMLSNLYASCGRWDDVRRVRNRMKEMGVKKKPGCSWVEVGRKTHEFVAGDRRHTEYKEIEKKWDELETEIREIGYIPDTNSVLHDVEDGEKVEILCAHSEKLAMAYGLLKLAPGAPVRVTKNLRMCWDCHNAAKLVALLTDREIIIRDIRRFHHFKKGFCSCGDYW